VFLSGGEFIKGAHELLRRVLNERAGKPFDPGGLRGLIARMLSGARAPA